MPRMIDGDALLTDLGITHAVKYGNTSPEQRHMSYSSFLAYEVADAIRDAPTIDPERHARWARKDNSKNCKRVGDFEEWYECSACEGNAGDKSAYCPDCGARMDMEVPNE